MNQERTQQTRQQGPVTRRKFLKLAGAGAGFLLISACGGTTSTQTPAAQSTSGQSMNLEAPPTEAPQQPTQAAQPPGGSGTVSTSSTSVVSGVTQAPGGATVAPAPTMAVPSSFKEAPQLSALVKQGKLPEVSQRVPKTPIVLKPVEKAGTFGGTWNTTLLGVSDSPWIGRTISYDYLLRFIPNVVQFTLEEVVPGIAESYEQSEDGRDFTFKLREGMKWSDGKPFTADDIVFWYEDVFSNKDLTPTQTDWMTSDGKPVKVEKQDDLTVVFRFPKPNGLFLLKLAAAGGGYPTSYPAHYLKQYHKKYNPKVVQEAKKAKMDTWMDLFAQKSSWTENPDCPSLFAWILTKPLGSSTQRVVAKRNPYYWKVDTEGNQLPYLDEISYLLTEKTDVMVLKTLNGDIDMQDRHIATPDNKSILYKNQKKGHYHFFDETVASMNRFMLSLNLTTNDKNKRKVFNDLNFRIGLSYAINRQEIIDVVFVSQGEPWQGAPRKESKFYNEKLAKQYTEHDLKKANEYLDKALPKKDESGKRLGPDGKPFAFNVETTASPMGSYYVDVLNMIKRYWGEVGITMEVKNEERSLFYTRKGGNQPDATTWEGDGGLEVMLEPRWYFPYSGESNFAIPWANWYNLGGLKGKVTKNADSPAQEPPEAAKQQMKLYDQIKVTPDPKKREDLMKQILDIAQKQFWCMGMILPVNGYGVAKNSFHNVPDMTQANICQTPGQSNTCQYWTEEK